MKITGTVYSKGGRGRLTDAIVELLKENKDGKSYEKVSLTTSDRNGNFDLGDVQKGTYHLKAYHTESTAPKTLCIAVNDKELSQQDLTDPQQTEAVTQPCPNNQARIDINLMHRHEIANDIGRVFFYSMVGLLFSLVVAYAFLHAKYPSEAPPVNRFLTQYIGNAQMMVDSLLEEQAKAKQASTQTDNTKNGKTSESEVISRSEETTEKPLFSAIATTDDDTSDEADEQSASESTVNTPYKALSDTAQTDVNTEESYVFETVNIIDKVFKELQKENALANIDSSQAVVISRLIGLTKTAAEEHNWKKVSQQLDALNQLTRQKHSYFWQQDGWRLLELLFWAAVATVLRLAISAGRHIHKQDFRRHAVQHNIAYIFAVPIMAVLIALALSFISINLNFGDAGISLDLRNITVSIVVAALVGLAPWRASEFLENLADAFFNSLSKLFNATGDKNRDEANNGGEAQEPLGSQDAALFENNMTSDMIKRVQTSLAAATGKAVEVTGEMTPETRNVLEEFSIQQKGVSNRIVTSEIYDDLLNVVKPDNAFEESLSTEQIQEIVKTLNAQLGTMLDENKDSIDAELRAAIQDYQSTHEDLEANGLITEALLEKLLDH